MNHCSFCYKPCRYSAARGMSCEPCYLEREYGFDRNRRDAERLANMTGDNFVVVEITMNRVAARAAKYGQKAYTVWSSRVAKEPANHWRIVEEYAPNVGRIYQSPEAP